MYIEFSPIVEPEDIVLFSDESIVSEEPFWIECSEEELTMHLLKYNELIICTYTENQLINQMTVWEINDDSRRYTSITIKRILDKLRNMNKLNGV